jgi:hypothetical protein
MNVNLNVFDAAMLNWIGGHVDSRHIINVDGYSGAKWVLMFLKKLTRPTTQCNSVDNNSILSFRTRVGDSSRMLGEQRDETATILDAVAASWAARIWTTSPVSIRASHQCSRGRCMKMKTKLHSTTNIPKNSLEKSKMRHPWGMHNFIEIFQKILRYQTHP